MSEETIQHPRVLVIEDDDTQREMICQTLRVQYGGREGCNVVGVACADHALQQDLDSFDVVLQDYNLPDMSGLRLIGKILSRADLPIIMVTGENVSETAVKAIRRGAQDYVVKLGDYLFALPVLIEKNIRLHRLKKDNQRLQLDLKAMLDELRVRNIQLTESLAKLAAMARTDPLTGLANRRQVAEMLERLYAEAARYEFDLTCCMCDLDRYKDLNDTLGHQVGDQVLIATAQVIRSCLRSSDVAARYGGDEFVVLLPHTCLDRGCIVAERIRGELVARIDEDEAVSRPVTLSVGIASLGADRPESHDQLVSMADRALYAAKETGRDRVLTFSRVRQPAMA